MNRTQQILACVAGNPGITSPEITARTGIKNGTLAPALILLEERGHIDGLRAPRRVPTQWTATAAGRARLAEIGGDPLPAPALDAFPAWLWPGPVAGQGRGAACR